MRQPEEMKNFTECFRNVSPTSKVKKRDYLAEGVVPVIDQGEEFIGGYTNDSTTIQDLELPVILFGDHTRRFKFVNSRFAVGADGVKILRANPDLLDEKFAFYQLLQAKFSDKGYSRHYQYLKKVPFWVPKNKQIQIKTVEAIETQFTRLDAAVKSLKTIKSKLEIYRQSVLKAAFEGKIVEGPDYEIYRISDFCDKVPKIDPPREKFDDFYYIDIGSIDNTKKTVNPPKIVQSNLSPSRARQETLPGDIVYSTVRVYLKNLAMVPELLDRRIISSTGFTVLRPNEKLHNKYLFYYLLSDSVTRMLSAKQRGTSYPAIRDNDVFESPIPVPPKEAQEMVVDEIESRFSVIDKVEEVVDNALLKAERLRKSILKSAFEGKLISNFMIVS